MKRRLAALMVGDIVDYSGLMERAEEQTAERLAACQSLISDKVGRLEGRIFNTAGDAAFAEFPSPVNAVRSAFEIRSALAGLEGQGIEPLNMRFGLHIADVMVQGDDLIGDGVNLTARIQAAAEPGSIYVSGALFEHVRRNAAFIFDDVGKRPLKNISDRVQLYRVREEIGKHRLQAAPTMVGGVKEARPCSLAVLPFRIAENLADLQYLAEGLAEELIVELARFHRLSVSSRSASFAVVELKLDAKRTGEMLGVEYILDGRLHKIGAGLTIALTLIETRQGSVVWSDKICVENILSEIDKIAAKVAATVTGRIEHAEMSLARRKLPENMTAYDCLLRGLEHHRLGGVTDDNARAAVSWFNKAIEADPNFASAYAWRVCAGSWLSDFDFEQGQNDARRALELDPFDAEANRIMGAFKLMSGHFDEAVAHHSRAMELNPSDAYLKANCAAAYTAIGKPEQALVLLDEAEALDPFLPVYCVEARGVALFALGRFHEALEALGSLPYQTSKSRLYRAAAMIVLERNEEARRLIREVLATKPDLTAETFVARECYQDPQTSQHLRSLLQGAGLP